MGISKFTLYIDTLCVLDEMDDRQAGKLFKAIKAYWLRKAERCQQDAGTGFDSLMEDFVTRIAFAPFKAQFERESRSYDDTVGKNKENGNKGGRPKKTQENPLGFSETQENPKKPLGFSETQENPKKPLGFSETQENPKNPLGFSETHSVFPFKTKTKTKTKKNKLSPIVDNLQKKADDDTPGNDLQDLQDGGTMPIQAGTLPAAQKEKSCAKKEKAAASSLPATAQREARLDTEEIIAEIERRAITAEQLAMVNGLDAAAWQAVKAEIFTQWRFEGYQNTLQDALNHFANLVRKKAGDHRKAGGQGQGGSVEAMIAGMLATARTPEQEMADDEQFKQDFGL